MLQITIPAQEYYDEQTNEFVTIRAYSIELEHSLISISKWESKWHKPFMSTNNKSNEELLDYIRCMTINKVPAFVYASLTSEDFKKINEYIEDSQTATWFNEPNQKKAPNREIVTSELIYYWMIAYSIPFECQKWHLNRLLTLIRVCSIKNAPDKKMDRKTAAARQRSLNAARKARSGSHG